MKKYFLFLLLTIALSIVNVSAETKLTIDCEPGQGKRVNEATTWQYAGSKFYVYDGKVFNVDDYIVPEGKYQYSELVNNFVTYDDKNNATVVGKDIGEDYLFDEGTLYVYTDSGDLKVTTYNTNYVFQKEYTFVGLNVSSYNTHILTRYENDLYIYLEKYNESEVKLYKLLLDTSTFEEIPYSKENFEKYFEEYYRKRTIVDNGLATSVEDVYVDGNETVYIKDNTIKYVSGDNGGFEKNVIDAYVELKNPKIVGKYIIVAGAKEEYKYKDEEDKSYDKYFSRTDLLVFDKQGNLLQTLAENKDYLDYMIFENKLYLTTHQVEGVCTLAGSEYYEIYNNGCEGSWENLICELKEVKEPEEIENSETNDSIIIIFAVLILSTIYLVRKSKTLV